MQKLKFLAPLFLLLLIGCGEQSEEQKAKENAATSDTATTPLKYVVITTGSTSAIQTDMTSIYKLDTPQSFAEFWVQHSQNIEPAEPSPVIDFNKDMVIAIVDADQPSSGYTLTIDRLEAVDDKLYIFATRKQPGAGCVNLGMISQPFVIIQLPQSPLIPELRLETETVACN